ncbi:hypothetical protein FA13DRAFT_492489 [Coprinellus micaceus]|uniref:Uncharacterized protein n=1 Tax=Coprinellus micaceus TaxID=71717 RepID=A0A4Y7T993_COPMI|nr:hypothetical protein FA13DRAFT_492489 [Coprinellus micaceus]
MSTVSLATLPQETLDAIVDAVASENDAFVTLRALAVTNRSILSRCRRHLFRVVRLTYEGTFPTTPFAHPRPTSTRLQGLFAFLNESVLSGNTIGVTPVGAFVQVLKVTNTLSPLVIQMTALMPNLRSVKVRANWNKEDERLCTNHEALCQALGGIPQQLTPNSFNADLMGRISRCLNELDGYVPPPPVGRPREWGHHRQTRDLRELWVARTRDPLWTNPRGFTEIEEFRDRALHSGAERSHWPSSAPGPVKAHAGQPRAEPFAWQTDRGSCVTTPA